MPQGRMRSTGPRRRQQQGSHRVRERGNRYLTGIPKQLDRVLPLGESFAYRLTDGKHAIAGRSFEADGDFMALTTFGDTAPSDAAISGTLSSLRSALE